MLILKDVLGTEVPAYVSDVSETQKLNEIGQLDFTLLNHDKNRFAYPLLVPRTIVIVPETGRMYRLSTNSGMSQGMFKQRTLTALHVGHDLHDKYIDTQLKGSQSIENCLAFLTKGTPFSYIVHDHFNHYSFSEGFGNGFADSLLLDTLRNNFNFEFYFENYIIHVYKTIGRKNQFVFIDNANCQKISDSADYTGIATHIVGEGKKDDKGNTLITAEYTSPNAKTYGIIDAEKISDDRFTDKNSLVNYLRSKLQDYPLVQYTIDATNFEKNLTIGNFSTLKVGDYGFLKDRFDIDIETRLISLVTYPQSNTAPKVTFGNKRFSLSQVTTSLIKNKQKTKKISDLSNEAKKNANSASKIADLAYNARIYGSVVKEVNENTKIIQLAAPEKNEELQLEKEEQYYPTAHAEGVKGLEKFIQKRVPTIGVTSVDTQTGEVILTAKKSEQLATPRMINGVLFDGSADIQIPLTDESLIQRVEKFEERLKRLEDHMKG